MRIHRIRLKNFRGVAAAEVLLAVDGVTVIEGANEVGKSSLAEAIDLILEQPDSSSKAVVKAVKPVHCDEGAEVEIELTTGDYHVVYTKRWHKHPQTTLRILTPTAEARTGRDAHDRMRQILDETLDTSLWKALRYQQGASVAQAALDDSPSLTSALDAAASTGSLGGPTEMSLWAHVEDERLRYFTPGGKPTTARAELDRKLTQARNDLKGLRAQLDALDEAAERHGRLTAELRELGQKCLDQQRSVDTYAAAWNRIELMQRQVESFAQTADLAEAEAQSAKAACEHRAQLVERVRAASETLEELNRRALREAPELVALQRAHAAAVARRDQAREQRRTAETITRLANDDYEYFRELMGLELLVERSQRVAKAQARLGAAAAFLESCTIDEDTLTAIENAFIAALTAQAQVTSETPTVRIQALQDVQVVIDGGQRALGQGEAVEEHAARDSLELVIGDVARVTVTSAAATTELQGAADETQAQLAGLYRSVGVVGPDALAQARNLERRRQVTQRDADEARAALQENLRDLTPQLMAEKIERAKAQTVRYQAQRDSAMPLPTDRDEAELRSQTAASELEQARALEDEREAELVGPGAALDEARTHDTERGVRIQLAQQTCHAAEDELSAARTSVGDEDLRQRYAALAEHAKSARDAHRVSAAELAEQDPEGTSLILFNAREVLERMGTDNRALESELTKIAAELEIRGEQGLQDQFHALKSATVHLELEKAQQDRRSAAVQLLYETLSTHRDAAKRSYVLPFRNQVETLGRVVFGSSLLIEIDHEDLRIVSRTLGGVTVPYDSLSTGAKEQLCVISRLACAILVNPKLPGTPGRGAPVIIDDAFGYSDADRLERLGAVLALAGRQCQIVVLTCTPERYRNVGTAKVIRLPVGQLVGELDESVSSETNTNLYTREPIST